MEDEKLRELFARVEGYVLQGGGIKGVRELKELIEEYGIDSLTGLYTRGFFVEKGRRYLERAIRNNSPISLVRGDVDYFKNINDGEEGYQGKRGHDAGDAFLRDLGHILSRNIRPGDLAGRVGGDEVAVLLPDANPDAAYQLAERIRKATVSGTEQTLSLGVYGVFIAKLAATS
jgi:diguanylate cyclase (GGDEF)-like protein